MQEALSGLKDIHLPSPVGWWPPAPGWWLLAALGLLVLYAAWRAWSKRRRRRALRDEALAELAAIRAGYYSSSGDPQRLARELSRLLRRVAISRFPREEVAGLVGDDWLAFLDRTFEGDGFARGPGRILVEAPYRSGSQELDADALFELVRRWLEAVTREGGHA